MINLIFVLLSQFAMAQSIDREYTVKVLIDKSIDVRTQVNNELMKAIAKEFGTLDLATPGSDEKLTALVNSSNRWIALSRPGELKIVNEVAEQTVYVKLRLDELEKSLARFGFSAASSIKSSFLTIIGPLPLNLHGRLKESIRIASRDIRSLNERRISADKMTYEMTTNGSLEVISTKIEGLRVGEYILKTVQIDGNELKMGVSK